MAAADRSREVRAGEEWEKREVHPSNYDRGAGQAQAFSRVLNRWNPLQGPPKQQLRRLSNAEVAERIRDYLGWERYWLNDVQRSYNGEARMHHLKPKVVEAYCVALERTDPGSMAEAFFAIELKPPVVTREALKLAIATSRSSSGRRSA